MSGSTAISSNWAPSSASSSNPISNPRRKRDFAEVDTVPATSSTDPQTTSRKQRRVGPAPSIVPQTLPVQPHKELLEELRGRYEVATASVISSSKIGKKVTAVLAHLGHVDLFSPDSRPGVMMLHARAGDASKMVTVMELAKRRMGEAGIVWYQYNCVYEIAGPQGGAASSSGGGAGSQIIVEDTVMGGAVYGQEEEEQDDGEEGDDDDFEQVDTHLELATRDKPAVEPKSTYMSVFLSRVSIPELQAKASMTLQTNANESGSRRKA